MSSFNKTTADFLDNRDAIANRKSDINRDLRVLGSTKNKTEIFLKDPHNTVIYCSKKKDKQAVEFIYRRHLGLDTTGLKAPRHMVNGIEPDIFTPEIEQEDEI